MSLAYLISPAFQYENESGKPLVGGTIRVCRHGTTEPYITYADFQGNRNPEYVPLNSKGMAVLLADDSGVYDVYCYDRNGVEQWSRLNVPAGGQGGGGGGGDYYAGYGIDIEEGVISVDGDVVQGKLTEGSGIDIVNNEIGIRVDGSTITVNVDGELEANIPAQVNADWNSSSGVSEILNKPDLSQYATQSDLSTGLAGKQDTLTAGTGIDITGTTISVESPVPAASPSDEGKVLGVTDAQGTVDWVTDKDTTYSAGTGLTLTGTTFSVDNAVPSATGSDNGKVLGVTDSQGTLGWVSQPTFTQQQSDWTEADTTDPSFIQNKPAEKSLVAGTGISITEGTTDITIASTAEALPSKTGHGGEALLVNSSATGLEWGTPTAELFEAVYGTTTYAQVTQAIAAKKIVYCRVPQSGTAVRMAFLAYVGSSNVEFQYYRSKSSRTYSSPTDEIYVYTVSSSGWTTTTRNTGYAIEAGTGLKYSISGDTLTLSERNPLPTLPVSSYKQYSLMYSTNPNKMSMSWSLRDSRNLSMIETTVGLDSSSSIVITQYMLDNNFAYIYLDKTKFPGLGGGYQWWDVNLWGMRIYKQTADASLAGTEWDMPLTVTTSQIATPDNDLNTMYVSTLRFKWPTSGQGQFTDYQGGLAFTVDLLNSDTDAMFIKIGLSGCTSNLAVGDQIYVSGRARPCTNIM